MIYVMTAAVLALVLDQATKQLAESRFAGHGLRLGRVVTLRHFASRRARYAQVAPRIALTGFWIAACIAVMILIVTHGRFQSSLSQAAVGAALGGAAGNLLDILRTRSVRDFIDLGWWPVFNVADVVIIGGLVFALLPR